MQDNARTNHEKDPEINMKIYNEINTSILFTNEVSFKLLGLFPFVSGASILGLVLSDLNLNPVTGLIAIFAAIVIFALFIWELRNIQMCK